MSDLKTGKCLCGAISFRAFGPPLWVAHCHCRSCRRSTGAPVATFVGFPKRQVNFAGERRVYQSSPGVYRGFCGECGTPVSYEADRCADEVHLYISVMDDPDALVPQVHVHHAEHIGWLELHDALPRFAGAGQGIPDSWGPNCARPGNGD